MDLRLFFFACTLNLFYYVPNLVALPVIGGIADDDNVFKYHVSIQINHNPGPVRTAIHYCGGSIISNRYVLSAAHRFIEKINGVVTRFYQPGILKMIVLAGTSETRGPGVIVPVSNIFIRHAYNVISNAQGQQLHADIAVLKLEFDLRVRQNSDLLRTLPLDSRRSLHYYENRNAVTMGNGCDTLHTRADELLVDDSERLVADRRHILHVRMLDRYHCPVFDRSICAQNLDLSHVRTCASRDDGSPLVYDNHVIGVLSQSQTHYDTQQPLMTFTRVSIHTIFIRKAMNPNDEHNDMYILDN